MRIISWNVNGIRAALRSGFSEWLKREDHDIVCLQEVKAGWDQVEAQFKPFKEYTIIWNAAAKAGYSGVAVLTKETPRSTCLGLGISEFDNEGRVIILEFDNFYLYNIYFPNGQRDQSRLDYKMRFYDVFLDHAEKLRKSGKAILSCGDFNTAHKEIDLKNPKANEKTSGFLPVERAWMDKFVKRGYVDTFRMFNPEPEQYTWWTYRFEARKRNIGWRIDYFFIDEEHQSLIQKAFIQSDITGSDHCPIGIEIKI